MKLSNFKIMLEIDHFLKFSYSSLNVAKAVYHFYNLRAYK